MSVRIGRVLGVPIEIHATCVIALIVLSCSIGFGFIAKAQDGIGASLALVTGGLAAGLLYMCLLGHELAHAIAARRSGVSTGPISLFIFGGSAQLNHDPESWSGELGIALAGPAASLLIAGVFGLGYAWVDKSSIAAVLLFYLAFANAVLAVANLLPGYPLDGGRALKAILWRLLRDRHKATRIATACGECIGVGLAAWGLLGLLRHGFDGLWLLGIGWYLADAAARSWEQERVRTILEQSKASDIITDHPMIVSPDDCVGQLNNDRPDDSRRGRTWPVVDETGPVGVVTESRAEHVPAEKQVRDVMASISEVVVVGSADNAWDVAERVGNLDENGAVIVADGRNVIGVVEKRELPNLLTSQLRAMG